MLQRTGSSAIPRCLVLGAVVDIVVDGDFDANSLIEDAPSVLSLPFVFSIGFPREYVEGPSAVVCGASEERCSVEIFRAPVLLRVPRAVPNKLFELGSVISAGPWSLTLSFLVVSITFGFLGSNGNCRGGGIMLSRSSDSDCCN